MQSTRVGIFETDDDAALYRLLGFSLHIGITFKKKALYGKIRRRFCLSKRKRYGTELDILKQLIGTDKSTIPAVLGYQDRGKLTFPQIDISPN